MSSKDQSAYSGERLSFFQLFHEKGLQVEIPIIQRDYAQGRDNESVVRNTFLDALKTYLKENKPFRDLDFVYGTVKKIEPSDENSIEQRFIPLDGQQRLTTLFLLHWYLAQIAGQAQFFREVLCNKKGRSLFTYETRNSSKEFCNALMTKDIPVDGLLRNAHGSESVAETIKDQGWFYLSWTNDPTIRSMLNMLDAIHAKFSGCEEYFARLVDPDEPIITFLFLNLKRFKLTDDLYIKMNARGKPLTDFENFKARLEKKIKSFIKPWPEYFLSFRDEPVSGYEYFIYKIDNDWADLFWAYRKEATKDDTYDDELMNLMALVIANFHILRSDLKGEGLAINLVRFFSGARNVERLSFMAYEELGCLSQKMVIQLIGIFDLLHHDDLSNGRLTPYLRDNGYYSEEKSFQKVIANRTSYPEKLRFYAFYAGLAQGMTEEPLLSWMRVVFNLSENTIINTVDEYYRALRSLRDLVEHDEPVLDQLKQVDTVPSFSEAQVLEEKIKAHLLTASAEWKKQIVEFEAHSFFRGQIGFLLRFAGIVDYYLKQGDTDWGDSDEYYLESFKRYAESAAAVFTTIEYSSETINFAWERAVLTKGEYFTNATANRYNLLSARVNINNIERDHSWRRLLRLPLYEGSLWGQRQDYVKAVLDDQYFSTGDVRGTLELICAKALDDSTGEDWRMLLVKRPDLFRVCNQGFIVKNPSEIVLLHKSQRNHTHSELYSKFLELEIRKKDLNIEPFKALDYLKAKGLDVSPGIRFYDLTVAENHFEMKVSYELDRFHFLFQSRNNALYPEKLIACLTEFGFEFTESQVNLTESYFYLCTKAKQAEERLESLCATLREVWPEISSPTQSI